MAGLSGIGNYMRRRRVAARVARYSLVMLLLSCGGNNQHPLDEVLSDCDIHLEISDVAGKGAPRAIAEIPRDTEYCQTRQSFQAQLAAHNVTIGTNQDLGEIDPAIPVDITGLAFEDEPHATRGSALVKTIWELHPAIVRLTQ